VQRAVHHDRGGIALERLEREAGPVVDRYEQIVVDLERAPARKSRGGDHQVVAYRAPLGDALEPGREHRAIDTTSRAVTLEHTVVAEAVDERTARTDPERDGERIGRRLPGEEPRRPTVPNAGAGHEHASILRAHESIDALRAIAGSLEPRQDCGSCCATSLVEVHEREAPAALTSAKRVRCADDTGDDVPRLGLDDPVSLERRALPQRRHLRRVERRIPQRVDRDENEEDIEQREPDGHGHTDLQDRHGSHPTHFR
jgi:hypothetical protein